MARGKASIQRFEHWEDGLARLNGRTDFGPVASVSTATTLRRADGASEIDAHIVDQLRLAYDELLSAPIPNHLNKLLTDLCKAEDKS
jgi:Anti-sigma factor NepR